MMPRRHCLKLQILLTTAALAVSASANVQHDQNHGPGGTSTLLFPHAIFGNNRGDLKPSTPDRIDAIGRELATSVFISFDGEKFRFLTEMLVSNFEKDIERFQFGYKFDTRNTLWLGRFHNPAGIWNIEHHHGAYLQTSISRPHIVAYEDGGGGLSVGGGVLPMHLTGLLWEGSRAVGMGAVNYEIGFARGPALGDALLSFPILKTSVPGKALFTTRVGFKPDETGGTQAGVFATMGDIPVTDPMVGDFSQSLLGVYAQLSGDKTRIFGEWFDVSNRGSLGGPVRSDKFNAWFVQGEYRILEPITAYARFERSRSNPSDPYLALFPHFPKATDVIGLRWDFMPGQAITMEYAASIRRDDSLLTRILLQWSAVFK